MGSNPPSPFAIFSSLRSLNYSVESSLADLVDNSVTAGATTVNIDFRWNGGDPIVEVIDNGDGMSRERLIVALRLAGRGPTAGRPEDDLGRFGLGLKTASLAHCKRLTVTSVSNGELTHAGWDLDILADPSNDDKWTMAFDDDEDVNRDRERIGSGNGTVVRWRKFDRLLAGAGPDDSEREDAFNVAQEPIAAHLGMVFSRFLMRPKRPLRITCNGRPVEPWDPTLRHLESKWASLKDLRHVGPLGHSPDGKTTFQTFVLPREDEFPTPEDFKAAGRDSWNELQGFWVYRADRLIYGGGYLNLGWKFDEHAKLGRIIVDIPNSDDDQWELGVTKEQLRPPHSLRSRLRAEGKSARAKAQERYRRTRRTSTRRKSADVIPVWLAPDLSKGSGAYKVNRRHPAFVDLELVAQDRRPPELAHEGLSELVERVGEDHDLKSGAQPVEGLRRARKRIHPVDDALDVTDPQLVLAQNLQALCHQLVVVRDVPGRRAKGVDARTFGEVDPDFGDQNPFQVEAGDFHGQGI